MERKLSGKRFILKEGVEKDYEIFVNLTEGKYLGNEKEIKEFIDPMTALLVIGGVAWAISRTSAKELEEKYIKYID